MADHGEQGREASCELAERIGRAVTQVDRYLAWRNASKLAGSASPAAAPGSPAEANLLERLKSIHEKEMDAKRTAVSALKSLPDGLERAGFDSTGVLRLSHFIDGGGGPDDAYATWAEVKTYLQRAAIQLRNRADAQAPCSAERPDQPPWHEPGLPDSLVRLAQALEGGRCTAAELAKRLYREPSRILSDHRADRWGHWVKKWIGRDRGKGMYWLKRTPK